MTFKAVFSPENEIECMFLKSQLETENIPYFILGECFASWLPGPQIHCYNRRYFMIDEQNLAKACAIVDELRSYWIPSDPLRITDQLINLIEWLVMGWFISGRRISPSQCIKNALSSLPDLGARESNWLYDDGVDAYENHEFEKAIELFHDYLDHQPYDKDAMFNLMCTLVQQGMTEEAKDTLNELIQAGFNDYQEILDDPSLEPVHSFAKDQNPV